MAYLRWSEDSSVYVFRSVHGYFECCACLLLERKATVADEDDLPSYTTPNPVEMVEHLRQHLDAGDKVPDLARVERRLYEDASGVPLDCGGLH